MPERFPARQATRSDRRRLHDGNIDQRSRSASRFTPFHAAADDLGARRAKEQHRIGAAIADGRKGAKELLYGDLWGPTLAAPRSCLRTSPSAMAAVPTELVASKGLGKVPVREPPAGPFSGPTGPIGPCGPAVPAVPFAPAGPCSPFCPAVPAGPGTPPCPSSAASFW